MCSTYNVNNLLILCLLSAGVDYIETFKFLTFIGDSVQTVSIRIVDDGVSEPPETFLELLSSADGMVIPPNIHLEPNRATATIISENGMIGIIMQSPCN